MYKYEKAKMIANKTSQTYRKTIGKEKYTKNGNEIFCIE